MKLNCKVYQDLIPLYLSHTLSKESKTLLEEHLTSCPDCEFYLEMIRLSDIDSSSSQLSATSTNHALALQVKKLEKQKNIAQWAFLSCGVFLSILFTLSNNLLQNIIFLPLMGLIGYLLTTKTVSLSIIISIFLALTLIFKDAMSACFDGLFGYLIYLIVFFFLTLLGTLCGYLVRHASKDFKHQSRACKIKSIFIWIALLILSGLALNFTNNMNGNPLTACYAQFKMKDYLENTYPDMTANLSHNRYNFKENYYTSNARLYTEETTHTFSVFYRHGKIWDDYFTSYLEDQPTEYRLGQEAAEEIRVLLTKYNIPFLSVECYITATKGQYSNISFNKETFTPPFSVSIYRLTDTKQSYEDFALWCDEVRALLIAEGYHLSDLTLESDPHFMANRLSLTLEANDLTLPVEDVSSYKHFSDYGAMNNFDSHTTAQDIGYGKLDFYYNEALTSEITTLIRSLGYENAYAKAQVNENNELDLSIYWSGKRISIDRYAENVMRMVSSLDRYDLFNNYSIMPLSFQYGWGTSTESYSYAIYDEHLENLSEESIIDILLSEQSLK